MSVILLLIPLSILIAAVFLWAFIWAVRSGQYEDTTTPALRPLLDEVKFTDGSGDKERKEHCNRHVVPKPILE